MTSLRLSLVYSAVIAVATSAGALITLAAEQEYKPKVAISTLAEGPLPGVDGKVVIIKHFDLPPGHVGGRHYHPGPVYVYVAKGSLTIETEDGKSQTVSAGELYQEPLHQVMQARNTSTSDGVELVVFQIGDEGKPMMIKAE